jgi:hypothetical protein
MIVCKIAVNKINKSLMFKGQKHTYLDVVLHENRDGEDEFGNLGFISQSISKEARERGDRGPIIGNWKEVGQRRQNATERREDAHLKDKSNGFAPAARREREQAELADAAKGDETLPF